MAPNTRCAVPLSQHGPDGECPQNPAKRFRKHPSAPNSASQSFSAQEVMLLDQIIQKLHVGGDTSALVRHPAMANLARKARALSKSIERKRREQGR